MELGLGQQPDNETIDLGIVELCDREAVLQFQATTVFRAVSRDGEVCCLHRDGIENEQSFRAELVVPFRVLNNDFSDRDKRLFDAERKNVGGFIFQGFA
jgi:hypothetical protein